MPPNRTIPSLIWEALWKVNMVAVPMIIAWGVWVTGNIYEQAAWRNLGGRFTANDAAEMRREFDGKFASLPPPEWKARIIRLEEDSRKVDLKLGRVEILLENILSEIKMLKAKDEK